MFVFKSPNKKPPRVLLEARPELPAKDPEDFTLTKSSTGWAQERFCPRCKATVGHLEFISQICDSCGYFAEYSSAFKQRVCRRIFNGTKWVYQYNYGNSKTDIEIREEPHK